MKEVGTSTLLGKKFRFIGYLFQVHPMNSRRYLQYTFFEQRGMEPKHLLCLSEVRKKDKRVHQKQLIHNLGDIVSEDTVIPYVQRAVEKIDYAGFRTIIEESFSDCKIVWWNE